MNYSFFHYIVSQISVPTSRVGTVGPFFISFHPTNSSSEAGWGLFLTDTWIYGSSKWTRMYKDWHTAQKIRNKDRFQQLNWQLINYLCAGCNFIWNMTEKPSSHLTSD